VRVTDGTKRGGRSTNDATAHAEVVAIREAGKTLNTFDLSGCDLYVNGSPCCMCFASILWAGISRVFYLLSAKDAADIGLGDQHLYDEMARPIDGRCIPFISMPELDEEARDSV
jgi:tRNA(Arg) A34 adenosine deaminase TadA